MSFFASLLGVGRSADPQPSSAASGPVVVALTPEGAAAAAVATPAPEDEPGSSRRPHTPPVRSDSRAEGERTPSQLEPAPLPSENSDDSPCSSAAAASCGPPKALHVGHDAAGSPADSSAALFADAAAVAPAPPSPSTGPAPVLPPSRVGSRRGSGQAPPAILTCAPPVGPCVVGAGTLQGLPAMSLPTAGRSPSPSFRTGRSPTSRGSATPPPESNLSPGALQRARSQSVTHLPSQLEQRQRWLARKEIKYRNQSNTRIVRGCCF